MGKDIFEKLRNIDNQVEELTHLRVNEYKRVLEFRKYNTDYLYTCDATYDGHKYVEISIEYVAIIKDLATHNYVFYYSCQLIDENGRIDSIYVYEEELDKFNLVKKEE